MSIGWKKKTMFWAVMEALQYLLVSDSSTWFDDLSLVNLKQGKRKNYTKINSNNVILLF